MQCMTEVEGEAGHPQRTLIKVITIRHDPRWMQTYVGETESEMKAWLLKGENHYVHMKE